MLLDGSRDVPRAAREIHEIHLELGIKGYIEKLHVPVRVDGQINVERKPLDFVLRKRSKEHDPSHAGVGRTDLPDEPVDFLSGLSDPFVDSPLALDASFLCDPIRTRGYRPEFLLINGRCVTVHPA